MSILIRHVVGATCESSASGEPRFGKFSTIQLNRKPTWNRMAAKPENFAKAGFFFSCRTPNVIKGLHGLRGTEQVWPTSAHCKSLAYLTGGDVIQAWITGSRVKGVTGESLAGRLASVKLAATITGFAGKASGFKERMAG